MLLKNVVKTLVNRNKNKLRPNCANRRAEITFVIQFICISVFIKRRKSLWIYHGFDAIVTALGTKQFPAYSCIHTYIVYIHICICHTLPSFWFQTNQSQSNQLQIFSWNVTGRYWKPSLTNPIIEFCLGTVRCYDIRIVLRLLMTF